MKPDRKHLKNKENSTAIGDLDLDKVQEKAFEGSAKSKQREKDVDDFMNKECPLTEVERVICKKYYYHDFSALLKARKAMLEVEDKKDYEHFKKQCVMSYKHIKKIVDVHQAERIKKDMLDVWG